MPVDEVATAVVEAEGLSKSFGGRVVLDRVDLHLRPGTLTRLVGRSGCGKSTLLRILAGLEAADAGVVRIGGLVVSNPGPVVPPHRRDLGMVFQHPALWPHMSVAGHVAFAAGARLSGAALRSRVAEVLDLVGIAGLAERRPAGLSGGEAARTALARAIAAEPACLLLDEPLAHLDGGLRQELAGLLRRITDRTRAATLFVTHTPEDLAGLADASLRLADGRLEPDLP